MKKIISVFLIILMLFGASCTLISCGGGNKGGRISIVTTIFPVYDWVSEVMGEVKDDASLTLLLDNGVDMHNYQPTAKDIVTISNCDMFVYVGGESDTWVDDVLKTAANEDMVVINLVELLGEDIVIENTDHDHDHDEHESDHEHEVDEHVWLSLKNAKIICEAISDSLSEIDPENEATFTERCDAYVNKLTALDAKYADAIGEAEKNTLLFADRFPFRYLAKDYGLHHHSAFSGCSSESEASFETIMELAEVVDREGLRAVLTIDGSDTKLAETVISNTKLKNQDILSMNSMQAITEEDIKNGVSYLSVMEENLEVLTLALQ